ncbi:MAG: helix-turn-helix domain-containing protein, partial [Blautia sp.]|nr:helix-turn-helix domain-containing protein [Blautia sp.]
MDEPALLFSEEAQGNLGYIYHFDGEFSLVPFPLLFLVVLKGELSCLAGGERAPLFPGDMALLEGEESLAGEAQDCYCLLVFLSETAFITPKGHLSWRSGVLKDEAKKRDILGILSGLAESELLAADYAFLQSAYLWNALCFLLCTSFGSWEGARVPPQRKGKTPISAGKGGAFGEILAYLEEKYEEKITLKALAEQFFYTPSHLSKLFVRQSGVNFYEYLSSLRLSKALPLLLQTGLDIGVIADRVGFPNQRSFSQAFQKHYHCLPSEYRSAHAPLSGNGKGEDGRENLKRAKDRGLLDILQAPQKGFPPLDSCQLADYGSFSLEGGENLGVHGKNNVLTVARARDLLLSPVQDMVRMLAGSLGFTYLTCHGFLANDLQIASVYRGASERGIVVSGEERTARVRYDFSMYETIFQFVKSTGLYFIIQLSYTPSLLAEPGAEVDPVHRSCICMPASIKEWNRYIKELFTFLKDRFGAWLDNCRVTLWKVPDVHIFRSGRMTPEEYLLLYENTYRTVKEVAPEISFESPTISITKKGLSFQKLFLTYCQEKGCPPAALNYVHYYRGSKTH